MKAIYIAGMIILLAMPLQESFGQSTIVQRDITWYSDQNVELHSSTTINATCAIITHNNSTIDLNWDGVTTFTIQSIDGSWTDPTQDGTLTYHVQYQAKNGSVAIQRLQGAITVIIDLTLDFPDGMKEQFMINRFE